MHLLNSISLKCTFLHTVTLHAIEFSNQEMSVTA